MPKMMVATAAMMSHLLSSKELMVEVSAGSVMLGVGLLLGGTDAGLSVTRVTRSVVVAVGLG